MAPFKAKGIFRMVRYGEGRIHNRAASDWIKMRMAIYTLVCVYLILHSAVQCSGSVYS